MSQSTSSLPIRRGKLAKALWDDIAAQNNADIAAADLAREFPNQH